MHNDDGEIDAGINLEIEVESLVFRATSPFSITDICLQEMESEHGFRIMKIDD